MLYVHLTLIVVSMLLGAVAGFWWCLHAINCMMAADTIDIYRRGIRLVRLRVF